MALTKERRNEIADMYLQFKLRQKKLQSLEDLSSYVGKIMPGWARGTTLLYARSMQWCATGRKSDDVTLNFHPMPEETRHVLSWEFLLEWKFLEGIRIGAKTKREVGNTAKQLGITTSEAYEVMLFVVNHIVRRLV